MILSLSHVQYLSLVCKESSPRTWASNNLGEKTFVSGTSGRRGEGSSPEWWRWLSTRTTKLQWSKHLYKEKSTKSMKMGSTFWEDVQKSNSIYQRFLNCLTFSPFKFKAHTIPGSSLFCSSLPRKIQLSAQHISVMYATPHRQVPIHTPCETRLSISWQY